MVFIGNSFTFGAGSRCVSFAQLRDRSQWRGHRRRARSSTPSPEEASQGRNYAVKPRGPPAGKTDWHLENKGHRCSGARGTFVMHGYSTLDQSRATPLQKGPVSRPARPRCFIRRIGRRHPPGRPWSRADQVYRRRARGTASPSRKWRGISAPPTRRRRGLAGDSRRDSRRRAWNCAMQTGVATPIPMTASPSAIDLWTHDHYHASSCYYLSAPDDL